VLPIDKMIITHLRWQDGFFFLLQKVRGNKTNQRPKTTTNTNKQNQKQPQTTTTTKREVRGGGKKANNYPNLCSDLS